MIKSFPIAQYELLLRTTESVFLPPYKGSTFRGGFGTVLRKVVCIEKKGVDCKACLLKQKCLYSYIFETPPPAESQLKGKYLQAPHPFIIEPPFNQQTRFKPGAILILGLILIGRCLDYLPYFIFTFDELGKYGIGKGRGKYQLEEVRSIHGPTGQRRSPPIYSCEDKILGNIPPPDLIPQIPIKIMPAAEYTPAPTITLKFITPTRIKVDGHLTLALTFPTLMKHLLERLALLSYFHCGGSLDIDFTSLLEQAHNITIQNSRLHWYDWERYSSRQDSRMKLGGFIGRISYQGELSPFLPYLQAGQLLHIGKGTSFGLGKYLIEDKN